jgi:sugar-specific transcriptional regulator TrmB
LENAMDGPGKEGLLESLRQIGLNRYEASVYLGLVTDQTARVAEISRRTGVPQPKVYQALDSLVEKGFCAQGTDSVNRYRPIQPRIAIEAKVAELKRQEDEARALASELEVLLLAGQGQELWAPPIEVVKGTRQIVTLLVDRIHAASEEILYCGKVPQIPALEMAQALDDRARDGVQLKLLLEPGYLTPLADSDESREEVELFRSMPAEVRELEGLPTKLLLVDRQIALLSISRSGGDGFLVLALRQQGFVEHVLASFDHHWERARPR